MKVLQVMIVTKKVIILRQFCPAFISSSGIDYNTERGDFAREFWDFFEILWYRG